MSDDRVLYAVVDSNGNIVPQLGVYLSEGNACDVLRKAIAQKPKLLRGCRIGTVLSSELAGE